MFLDEIRYLSTQYTDDLINSGHKSEGEVFKSALNTFVLFLSERPYISCINDITRQDIEEYIEYIWKVPYKAKNAYRPSFVYRRLRALNHFFDYLTIREDELPINMIPQAGIILRSDFPSPNRRGIKHFPTWFDNYVREKILNIPDTKQSIRFKTMMLFIYHTGARSLDICTVEFDSVFEKNGNPWIRIFSNKMKREYEIPIVDELYDAIIEYKKVKNEEIKKHKKQRHPVTNKKVTFLFSYKGKPEILKASFSRKLKLFVENVIKQAETEGFDVLSLKSLDITSHKFRHNISIKLTRMGADPLLVAEFLGHSDLSMAQAYIQEDMEYIDKLFKELNDDDLIIDEPIIIDRKELLKAGDIVSKTNVGWCVHINGNTPCGNDPYQCWNCEHLQPKEGPEYADYLTSQHKLHTMLYERNIALGFESAKEAEATVIKRIEQFQKTLK